MQQMIRWLEGEGEQQHNSSWPEDVRVRAVPHDGVFIWLHDARGNRYEPMGRVAFCGADYMGRWARPLLECALTEFGANLNNVQCDGNLREERASKGAGNSLTR